MRADIISPLEIFKIGIGPSSSHTMGPMVAALEFRKSALVLLNSLNYDGNFSGSDLFVRVELFGSLSATGKGHATDGAICAGLAGLHPTSAEPDETWSVMPSLEDCGKLDFEGIAVQFRPSSSIIWKDWSIDEKPLPHPNTLRFCLSSSERILLSETIVSVGGGFVEKIDNEKYSDKSKSPVDYQVSSTEGQSNLEYWGVISDGTQLQRVKYPYNTATEFIELVEKEGLSPSRIVIANQESLGASEEELRESLGRIIDTMNACIERGLKTEGILPGGLNVKRRAGSLFRSLSQTVNRPTALSDLRPSVYAMAVNEENAAGGRVVTAPTNGSSGLIPAVWRTLAEDHDLSRETLIDGLIVASVIGALVKVHASISGAEVGCQGEVGTSCAMAAAGATAMLGGSVRQIEQAAEIGIEHHLGMTCDPIKGLVQVPCIERNAMGAVKALNAASLALASDGNHLVSLDKALAVMKQTGLDMNMKYKETSTGGLALG